MNKKFHDDICDEEETLDLVKNGEKLDLKLLKLKYLILYKLSDNLNDFWEVFYS